MNSHHPSSKPSAPTVSRRTVLAGALALGVAPALARMIGVGGRGGAAAAATGAEAPELGWGDGGDVVWSFYNGADAFAGWTDFTRCTPVLDAHALHLQITGAGAALSSEQGLAADAERIGHLRLVLTNPTAATTASVRWRTADDDWSDDRRISFDLVPDHDEPIQYAVPLAGADGWSGSIDQVQLVLAEEAASGTLSIPWIALLGGTVDPRSTIFGFDDGAQGWTAGLGDLDAGRGVLVVAGSGGARIDSPLVRVADASALLIRAKNGLGAPELALTWRDAQGAVVWTGSVALDPDAAGIQQCVIDPLPFSGDGTLRIEASGAGKLSLTTVRFVPAGLPADVDLMRCGRWSARGSSIRQRSDRIDAEWRGDDALLVPPAVAVDADSYGYARVRVANPTTGTSLRIFWRGNGEGFAAERSQLVTIRPADDQREYPVFLGQHPLWQGRIAAVAIAPPSVPSGTLRISSVVLTSWADTSETGRDLIEGCHDLSLYNWLNGWSIDESGGTVLGQVRPDGFTWEAVARPGGMASYKDMFPGAFVLQHTGTARTAIERDLLVQDRGTLIWEFYLAIDAVVASGPTAVLVAGAGGELVRFETRGDRFGLATGGSWSELCSVSALTWWGVRAELDLDAALLSVRVDDELVADAVELADVDVAHVAWEAAGDAVTAVGGQRIWKSGALFDDFLTVPSGAAPGAYTLTRDGGTIAIEPRSSLALTRDAQTDGVVRAAREVPPAAGRVLVEIHLIFGSVTGTARAIVRDASGTALFWVGARDGGVVAGAGDDEESGVWTIDSGAEAGVAYLFLADVDTDRGTVVVTANGRADDETPRDIATGTVGGIEVEVTGASERVDVRLLRIAPRIASTVAEVEPLGSRTGLVGVQSWSASIGENANQRLWWKYQLADKTPLLGFHVDHYQPEVVDWQTRWMLESGIDFIAHFTYAARAPHPPYVATSWLLTSELHAPSAALKHALVWDVSYEITQCGTDPRSYILSRMVPYWVETFLRHPASLRVDGRPVLLFFDWPAMISPLGGATSAGALLADLRRAVADRGVGEPVLIALDAGPETATLDQAVGLGFDHVSCYSRLGKGADAVAAFDAAAAARGLSVIAAPSVSWDSRLWNAGEGSGAFRYIHTPAQFRQMLEWVAANRLSADGSGGIERRMLLLDNFAEYGEGHSIAPSALYEFGYLRAVRSALGADASSRAGRPERRPAGNYDPLFASAWI